MKVFEGLTLPLKVKDGNIVDALQKPVLLGNWNSLETPLNVTGRQAILEVVCYLLNESFEYDKIDKVLAKLGY
jgi:hypothetical protein